MNVLLVDDHTLVRTGLAYLIRAVVADADVIEADSAEQALRLLDERRFDVALVDIRLPGRDGLQLLAETRSRWPSVPVIIVTNYDNPEYVRAAMAAGASGYLLKDATPADLSQAITVAISGAGNVISARAIQNLFDPGQSGAPTSPSLGRGRQAEAHLTKRETEILGHLAAGHSNREISKLLFLSEKTVKAHLATVFRKLGVSNRTQAAMAAVGMGLGPAPTWRPDIAPAGAPARPAAEMAEPAAEAAETAEDDPQPVRARVAAGGRRLA